MKFFWLPEFKKLEQSCMLISLIKYLFSMFLIFKSTYFFIVIVMIYVKCFEMDLTTA